jgi:hypothetical protein
MIRPIATFSLLLTLVFNLPARGQSYPPEVTHEPVILYTTLDTNRVTAEMIRATTEALLRDTREDLDNETGDILAWHRSFTSLGGERVGLALGMTGPKSFAGTLVVKHRGTWANRELQRSLGDVLNFYRPQFVGPPASLGETPWFEFGERARWRLPRAIAEQRRLKLYAAAQKAGGDAVLWGCVMPTDTLRTFARQQLPGDFLTDRALLDLLEAEWISIAVKPGSAPTGRIVAQFTDPNTANRYFTGLTDGLTRLRAVQPLADASPRAAKYAALLSAFGNVKPELRGSQLLIELDTAALKPVAQAASAFFDAGTARATTQPATAPAAATE